MSEGVCNEVSVERKTGRENDRRIEERSRVSTRRKSQPTRRTDDTEGGWVKSDTLDHRPSESAKREDNRVVSETAVANEYISFYPSCRECVRERKR